MYFSYWQFHLCISFHSHIYCKHTFDWTYIRYVCRRTGSRLLDAGPGSFIKIADDDTFERTFVKTDSISVVSSFVYFDNDMVVLSGTETVTPRKQIINMVSATLVRITEKEFIAGIKEHNAAFNVPKAIQVPMISDEVPEYNGTFPTEEQWYGELMNDTSCTTTVEMFVIYIQTATYDQHISNFGCITTI